MVSPEPVKIIDIIMPSPVREWRIAGMRIVYLKSALMPAEDARDICASTDFFVKTADHLLAEDSNRPAVVRGLGMAACYLAAAFEAFKLEEVPAFFRPTATANDDTMYIWQRPHR